MNSERHVGKRGYPLISLFILMSVCAYVAAVISPTVQNALEKGATWRLLVPFGGAISTMLLGIAVGLYHHRQPSGAVIGGGLGFLIGPALAVMATSKPESAIAVLIVCSVLSIVLVCLGLVYRWGEGPDPLDAMIDEPIESVQSVPDVTNGQDA